MKVEWGSGPSLLPISSETRMKVLTVLTDDMCLWVLAIYCQWRTSDMFSFVLSHGNRP